MGEHIRLREATERANASIEAVKQIAPHVQEHSVVLNALGQMLYEVAQRMTALEMVMTRYLEQQGESFSQLLADHIEEMQANATESGDSDEEPHSTENSDTDSSVD